jgi:CRISPR-associated protein Csx3
MLELTLKKDFQIIRIEFEGILSPDILKSLQLPSGIDHKMGVVISGRAPIWLYAFIVHELHPTAWVACYDPRLGAVVVATHSREVQIGQILDLPIDS